MLTLEQMKMHLKERKYTLEDLARISDVPLETVQRIFSGELEEFPWETRHALERVLLGWERISEKNPCYDDKGRTRAVNVLRETAPAYGAKKQGQFTIKDLMALPEDCPAELIDGVLYDVSMPKFQHQAIVDYVTSQVKSFIREEGGSCLCMDAGINVQLDRDDHTMVVPDMVILCDHKKINELGIYGAPDFVLEVLSPSTRRYDLTIKLFKYLEAGVREIWYIDPKKQILLVYLAEDDIPRMYPLSGVMGIRIYGGRLQIDLDRITDLILTYPVSD